MTVSARRRVAATGTVPSAAPGRATSTAGRTRRRTGLAESRRARRGGIRAIAEVASVVRLGSLGDVLCLQHVAAAPLTRRGGRRPGRAQGGEPAVGPRHGEPVTTSAVGGTGAATPGRPPLVQLLTPEGERVEHPDYAVDVTTDELHAFYRDLVLVRRIDAEATALQRQGELGLWASLLGQEAAQIGSGRALAPQDYVFPTYREHGVAWCRHVDPVTLLGLFRGVNLGGWDPAEHNFHLYTIVIGAQTLHATGYAMGIQRDGAVGTGDPTRDAAVIAYFGDGATAQGDVNEAFVFASVFNAPVVFFCQNNQWAISEPNERQTRIPLYRRAARLRLPRRPRRRQRRPRRARGDEGRARAGPRGRGADVHRGVHVPDGCAHDVRRPDAVPDRRRGRGVEAQGPDRPAQGAPRPDRAGRRRVPLRRRRRVRPASPSTCATRACRCPTPSR